VPGGTAGIRFEGGLILVQNEGSHGALEAQRS
jgi:hypothetical protein